jgi:hypothetical protein
VRALNLHPTLEASARSSGSLTRLPQDGASSDDSSHPFGEGDYENSEKELLRKNGRISELLTSEAAQ